ncbi:hypothetical protein LX36DRAFT_402602 [Colletotrichum falcatum]|nr:hypothetical protein LX36DRAFT_402602 [Colletotrichum falcatum]
MPYRSGHYYSRTQHAQQRICSRRRSRAVGRSRQAPTNTDHGKTEASPPRWRLGPGPGSLGRLRPFLVGLAAEPATQPAVAAYGPPFGVPSRHPTNDKPGTSMPVRMPPYSQYRNCGGMGTAGGCRHAPANQLRQSCLKRTFGLGIRMANRSPEGLAMFVGFFRKTPHTNGDCVSDTLLKNNNARTYVRTLATAWRLRQSQKRAGFCNAPPGTDSNGSSSNAARCDDRSSACKSLGPCGLGADCI